MNWYKPLLLCFLCGLAIFLRLNSIIMLIAFFIVLAGKLIRYVIAKDNIQGNITTLLLTGLSILTGFFLSKAVISFSFEIPEDAPSIPALTYLVMGSQDWTHPGWWNGNGLGLFEKYQYDVDSTNDAAINEIRLTLQRYVDDPKFCLDYYKSKLSTQWEAPMYHSLAMTSAYQTNNLFVYKLYTRQGIGLIIEKYMKIYQLLLYTSLICIVLIRLFNKQADLTWYTLLIGIYGGFLFSIIWEAKTRYIFPYFVLSIPYLAYAAGKLIFLEKRTVPFL